MKPRKGMAPSCLHTLTPFCGLSAERVLSWGESQVDLWPERSTFDLAGLEFVEGTEVARDAGR